MHVLLSPFNRAGRPVAGADAQRADAKLHAMRAIPFARVRSGWVGLLWHERTPAALQGCRVAAHRRRPRTSLNDSTGAVGSGGVNQTPSRLFVLISETGTPRASSRDNSTRYCWRKQPFWANGKQRGTRVLESRQLAYRFHSRVGGAKPN